MDIAQTIKVLENLKASFIIDQEYELAASIRKVIKFLELKEIKE